MRAAKETDNPDMNIDPKHIRRVNGQLQYGGYYTQEEMKEVMGLLGVTSLKQLDKSYIAPAMPTNQPGVHSAFPLLNLEDHGY